MCEKERGPALRWEPLGKRCRVLVTRDHGFSTDTILLAHFSMPGSGERCADLGTGCGAIPLLWRLRGAPARIWGVELQPEAAALARRSVEENGFSETVEIVQGDAGDAPSLFEAGSLDRIACNPPYFPEGSGPESGRESRKTARQDAALPLERLADAARWALRSGGRLCLCLRPERMAEALSLFREKGLEPKRLRLVQQRREKAPFLFLLECRKDGRSGLTVEPVLLLQEETGGSSPEMEAIYGEYRETAGTGTREKEASEAWKS